MLPLLGGGSTVIGGGKMAGRLLVQASLLVHADGGLCRLAAAATTADSECCGGLGTGG